MPFRTEWVRFGKAGNEVREKQYPGFLAQPDRAVAPVPGVIVIQEAWGVDDHIEEVTLRFAQAGYVALAPDLFAMSGERPAHFTRPRLAAVKEFINSLPPVAWGDANAREAALAKLPEPNRSEVNETFSTLFASALRDLGAYVPMLVAAADFLRAEHPLSRGAKVGAVGYCMGGGLSVRLACADPRLAAAVAYYGNAPGADEIAKITCPVLAFYGALDERVNAGIPDFTAAMKQHHKRLEHHVYEGAQHAFFNDRRPSYNARASRDAFARTLDLFRREL
jgi:carboxymethylenebutenolidase